MLEQLERLVGEVGAVHSKLILLVGEPGCGKTALLRAFAARRGVNLLNVGAVMGRRLAALPQRQRVLQAGAALRELADEYAAGDLLLIDNIELLFDRTLKLDPLDLLKRQGRARRIVVSWPGELHDGRLVYAQMGHPEYHDYPVDGVVPFRIESTNTE